MADPKWTPGPWRWVKEKPTAGSKPLAKLVGANDTEICNFGDAYDYYPSAGMEPNEYDKKLIAAAPDLYEACEWTLQAIDDASRELGAVTQGLIDAMDLLESVLRKARGEQQ